VSQPPFSLARRHFSRIQPAQTALSFGGSRLRITNGDCLAATVGAGQVFVERPGVRYQAQNLGPAAAEWFTTQLIPQGASTRVDEPAACGI